MKITPLEIRKQEFRKVFRGCDPVEVQTFLKMIAEQYEKLLEGQENSDRKILELESKLHDYLEKEKMLRETLLNVQEVKTQSEEYSRKKAELCIKEAELKATEITEHARNETLRIRDEINWLKSQKTAFINRIRHVLVSQIELLSVMEIDDALPEELKAAIDTVKPPKYSNYTSVNQQSSEFLDSTKTVRQQNESALPQSPSNKKTDSSQEIPKNSASGNEAEASPAAKHTDQRQAAASPEKAAAHLPATPNPSQEREIITQTSEEAPPASSARPQELPKAGIHDINEFFKKGIRMDELLNLASTQQNKTRKPDDKTG